MARPWRLRAVAVPGGDRTGQAGPPTEDLLALVARGEIAAYAEVFDRLSPSVYGLVRRVLRDPAQSEEVTQEVLIDVWRRAASFDPARGSAAAWVMTMAHRRAVDRVRREHASTEREQRAAPPDPPARHDPVAEEVEIRLEHEQVRRCLSALTELQEQSVRLAFYGGYTYGEVAEVLKVPLGTVKTRLRDGLIRLRDCLGVGR